MAKPIKLPTKEFLDECFLYDQDTGVIVWRARPLHHFKNDRYMRAVNNRMAGSIATCVTNNYRIVSLGGHHYRINRIIWKIMTGNDPVNLIDHRDNDSLNDRWLNLREATDAQNRRNSKLNRVNKLGIKGVSFRRNKSKYRASISLNGNHIHLGYFDTSEDAKDVYDKAAIRLHGEFANLG